MNFDQWRVLQGMQTLNAQARTNALLDQMQAREQNKPQCPHCGGPTEVGYSACKNCGRDVIWVGELVGKPGDEAELRQLHQQLQQRAIKEEQLQTMRPCAKCKINIKIDSKTCPKCNVRLWWVAEIPYTYGNAVFRILLVILLTGVIPLVLMWWFF